MLLVVNFEKLCETRLTDVKTNEHYLLAKKGEAHCKVGSRERLTLTRCCRGEHDGFLVLLEHELYVGTHGTEYLLHLCVLVLVYYDVGLCLGSLAGYCHIGNDWQSGEACHIVVSLNLVAEQLYDVEDYGRDSQSGDKSYKHDKRALGANLSACSRVIDEFSLVGSGGKRYGVFLTLLEKHQVKARLHFLLAANLCKHSFLLRCRLYLSLILVEL